MLEERFGRPGLNTVIIGALSLLGTMAGVTKAEPTEPAASSNGIEGESHTARPFFGSKCYRKLLGEKAPHFGADLP